MLELQRPTREQLGGSPSGLDDFLDSTPGGMLTVHHGVHFEALPVANMTVGEIRRRYGDRLFVEPGSQAQLDGVNASDDTICRPGQLLMFARPAGEKGSR